MAGIENGVTARLRAALAAALAARDATAASALRSALAAIGNAEAVGEAGDSVPMPATSAHFAGATAGLGSAEVPRRALSEAEIEQIVRAEIIDRQAAARHYDELGRGDQASRLRREIDVLTAALRRPRLAAAGPAVALRAVSCSSGQLEEPYGSSTMIICSTFQLSGPRTWPSRPPTRRRA